MANPQQHSDRTWTREGVAQLFAPGRLVQSAHQTCPGPSPRQSTVAKTISARNVARQISCHEPTKLKALLARETHLGVDIGDHDCERPIRKRRTAKGSMSSSERLQTVIDSVPSRRIPFTDIFAFRLLLLQLQRCSGGFALLGLDVRGVVELLYGTRVLFGEKSSWNASTRYLSLV